MKTLVTKAPLLAILGALTFAASAQAEFTFGSAPAWRTQAQTEFSGWEEFTVAFGGGNVPDLLDTTSDDAVLEQITPGAILTSTGNIYHPAGTPSFIITDSVPGDLIEVVLQIRSFGTALETQSPALSFVNASGLTVAVPYTNFVALGSAQGAEEYQFVWDLCSEPELILSYAISFEGAGAHMSLDLVHLDTRFDGNCVDTIGTNYCQNEVNSTGFVATLIATGSEMASQNDLTLQATQLPLNQFGYFVAGTAQGFFPNPGGSDGNLCLSGAIARFNDVSQIRNSSTTGEFSVDIDLTSIPTNPVQSVVAGQSWSFQCWHRDGNTSNFTDAVTIAFL